jgi:hypothetical protein
MNEYNHDTNGPQESNAIPDHHESPSNEINEIAKSENSREKMNTQMLTMQKAGLT